ncbi:MAG: SusC/RagA family TonB-linked outer membrane protein [Cyclobacteriaceae bacterium]|nr:SusC/RagA family TonB-linked outer membrane protein [Cyclobacteriaceae bacterium]
MNKFSLILTLLLAVVFQAFSQSNAVKGRVTSAVNGQGLPGVNILIKGTLQGTTTDLDGNYSVTVESGDVLVFKMVGMMTEEIEVRNQSVIDITLEEESKVLEGVVVTGFQEVDRKLFTGSAERLKLEEIQVKGEVDVSRMLEGQVAGVTVDNVSATFGSTPKIRIRGNTSINGNNQPLFVVDGVILEDLTDVNTEDFISGNANTLVSSSIANINPNDIESIQILKDASATAIYGARAANGVIVISTKRGRSGDLQVNYSGNFSFKLRPTYEQFDLLNSAEEMSVYRELFEKGLLDISTSVRAQNYGAMGKMFTLIADHELEWGPGGTLNETFLNQYENANTDWFAVLFNNPGFQQQHSLDFTTGSDKANSYYSISYLNDQGQTIADEVQRITGTARNTFFISDAFSFGLKLTGSYRDQQVPGTRNRELDPITGRYSRNFDINPLSYALNTARSIRPYDENGDLEFFRRNFAPFNILQELDLNYMAIRVVDLATQIDFEIKPMTDFSINGAFQARYANTNRDHTVHENSNQAEAYRADDTQFIQEANNLLFRDPNNPGLNPQVVLPVGGFKYLDQSDLLNFFARISGEWSKNLNEIHDINLFGGAEMRYSDRNTTSSTGLGVVYESGGVVITDPNIIEFFNLQNISVFSLEEQKDRFLGFFLNGGYAYKSRYVANLTARYDGSNQLGNSDQARYLPTWNVSGAWNVDQESFMNSFTFLNYLKFRATYGLSGNLPPESSALLNLQSAVTIRPTDVEPYLFIQDLTNTELTWEKLKEFNVGVDFGIFGERVNTSLDYYRRQSFDLIGIVQTSGIGGQGLKIGNYADMESDGFELSLNTVNIRNENFTWTTNFNVSYTKDVITKLDFGPRLVDAMGQNGAAVLGGPRRGLFSTQFAGLNTVGIPEFYDETGEKVFNLDLQSRENLDGKLVFEGPSEPRGAGGFNNTFSYKGLSLNVFISYKFDYKIRLNDAFYPIYTDFDALPGDLVDRWAVPGDETETDIPVILDAGVAQVSGDIVNAYNLYNKSTARVASGDYARLRTVQLSYRLPGQWVSQVGFRSVFITLEGNNLALLYSDDALNGQDPEFFATGGVALPPPKTITVAVNIGL